MFTGNMLPYTHLCDNDTVTVAMIYTLWTILLGHLSHHTNGNFKRRGDKVNKKGEKWEEGRQEEDNTAIDEDCSVFDMQIPENSGNWFGLFWVQELGAYQWLWDETRESPSAAKRSKLRGKYVICTWRSRFAYGAFNQTAVQLNSVDDFNNKVAQTSYSGILFCKYGSFPK